MFPKITQKQFKGNVNAACGLCKCYFYGDDFCNGKNLYIDMLEQKHVNFAYCRKGEELRFRDNDKSNQWFILGAKADFSPSKSWLAVILEKEGKYDKQKHAARLEVILQNWDAILESTT